MGGRPVNIVEGVAYGLPVTESSTGEPMTPTDGPGEPVIIVDDGGLPVKFINDDMSDYSVGLTIIFNGESNSGGYADNADATAGELAARSSVQILNNTTLTFQDLDVGTNNLIGHSGLTANATHGWEIGLANAVDAGRFTQSQVHLVKTGQGGSTIAQWLDGDASGYWDIFVERVDAAIALKPNNQLVIWMSIGINDAIAGTNVATWKTNLIAHIAEIRSAYGAAIPVILTKFEAPLAPRTAYNTAMDEVAAADSYTYAISSATATANVDGNHWDYDGYRLMAERLIDATFTTTASAPSISPASGEYAGQQSATITAASALYIRYTLNGTDPLTGTDYSSSFNFTPPLDIKAVAVERGKASASATNSYTAAGTFWDADIATANSLTLSNGDQNVVNSNASWKTILATRSKASGKHYIEYVVASGTTNANYMLGFANATFVTSNYMGTSAYSCGLSTAAAYLNGFTAGTGSLPVGNPTTNDVHMLAVDLDAGKLWIGKNGTWAGSGDPGAGTNASYTFTPATVGALFPGLSLYQNGGTWTIVALEADQTYSLPTGFSDWG